MGLRILSVTLLTLTLGLLAACESGQSMTYNTQPVPILASHEGSDANLAGPDVYVVNSAEQLAALGSQDLAGKNIDFSNRSLVIVTLGQRPTAGYAVRITGVQVGSDTLYVQGVETRPAGDAITAQVITHPYAAVEVPKLPTGLTVQPEIEEVTSGR